ncbi:MAG: hypothetical protein K6T85_05120, partial [Gorillibacterium sp.]|nr:hypothetical protein [Gorillibacterium sp.]
MTVQLAMQFEVEIERSLEKVEPIKLLSLDEYDKIIVSESFGKDSMACVFHLLNSGVPPDRIELWHQSVDGGGEQHLEFLDWPVTESYGEAVGQLLGIKTTFQWRAYGIY